MSTLIFLTGPSGSGKTTIAKRLQQEIFHKTMIISIDVLIWHVFNQADRENRMRYVTDMIDRMLDYGNINGFTIIFEGFWPIEYRPKLYEIINLFKDYHAYYLDISFQETVRRHRVSINKDMFGAKEMHSWYKPKNYLDVPGEKIIADTMTLDEIIQSILNDINHPTNK